MIIALMLGWWYGPGWLWALGRIRRLLASIGRVFAVTVLLRTWFAPWKQITTPSSLGNFFRAAVDNTVSRLVGGTIRTFVLLAAAVSALGVLALGLVWLLLWPLLPLGVVILPLLFVRGVTL